MAWQGWAVFLGYFLVLIGGITVLARFGVLVIIGYSLVLGALLLGIFFWKGEPQSMRDDSSP